jgi:hypothetical protein
MLTILGLLAVLAPPVPAVPPPADVHLVQMQHDPADRMWRTCLLYTSDLPTTPYV